VIKHCREGSGDRVEPKELAEIITSSEFYKRPERDLSRYHDELKSRTGFWQRIWTEDGPKAKYCFTTDNDWDIFEILTRDFARVLPGHNAYESGLGLHKTPPDGVTRFLIATPTEDVGSQTRTALGVPSVEKYLFIALLLTNNDQYMPLYASYVGEPPLDEERAKNTELVKEISREFTLDTPPPPKPAIALPPQIKSLIEECKTREFDRYERTDFVTDLLALKDFQLIEALSQLLPFTLNKPANWIIMGAEEGQSRLAKVHFHIIRTHPDIFLNQELREAPWKSGWMLPKSYDPILTYTGKFVKDRIY
jgi:hypothetical protein